MPGSYGAHRRLSLITLSRTALPAASQLLRAAAPLVEVLLPVGGDLVPITRFLNNQRDQVESSPFPAEFGGGKFPHLRRDAP